MKLNKHVRYRQEEDYILLCRIDTLQYFEIENKWLNLLDALKEGRKIDLATKESASQGGILFLEDLFKIGALEQ